MEFQRLSPYSLTSLPHFYRFIYICLFAFECFITIKWLMNSISFIYFKNISKYLVLLTDMLSWDALAYESQISCIKWLQFITLLFQGTYTIFFLMEPPGKKKKRRVGIYIQTKTEKSGGSGIWTSYIFLLLYKPVILLCCSACFFILHHISNCH